VSRQPVQRAPRRRLPPLHTLAAFDAAARHGSFMRAADELCITQSALSQRIRALEDFLRVKLFRRMVRRVDLTAEGAWLAPRVTEMLGALERSCADLGRETPSTRLTVSSVSSFARSWLVPRVGAFVRDNPQLELRVLSNNGFARTVPQDVDAAILWGVPTNWPGMVAFKFMNMNLFPVCSPELRRGPQALRRPEDLRHVPLLPHSRRNYWPAWLALANLGGMPVTYGPEYDDASLALEAAIHGQGVCMSNEALAGDEIRAGRLIRLFRIALPSDNSYYLVCREAMVEDPKVVCLREWLARAGAKLR